MPDNRVRYRCCGVEWECDEDHFTGDECLCCGKKAIIIESEENEEAFCDEIP